MSDYFKEFIEKQEKLDRDVDRIRSSARSAIYKIAILSSAIIGFSVTIASSTFLSTRIDLQTLYYSWIFFLVTIVIGFFILIFEPRVEHARKWRFYLLHGNVSPEEMKNLSFKQNMKVSLVFLKCLLRPENIYLDELSEDEKMKHEKEILSLVLVHRLAIFRQIVLFWLENIFFILFIVSLIIFISSFNL